MGVFVAGGSVWFSDAPWEEGTPWTIVSGLAAILVGFGSYMEWDEHRTSNEVYAKSYQLWYLANSNPDATGVERSKIYNYRKRYPMACMVQRSRDHLDLAIRVGNAVHVPAEMELIKPLTGKEEVLENQCKALMAETFEVASEEVRALNKVLVDYAEGRERS